MAIADGDLVTPWAFVDFATALPKAGLLWGRTSGLAATNINVTWGDGSLVQTIPVATLVKPSAAAIPAAVTALIGSAVKIYATASGQGDIAQEVSTCILRQVLALEPDAGAGSAFGVMIWEVAGASGPTGDYFLTTDGDLTFAALLASPTQPNAKSPRY